MILPPRTGATTPRNARRGPGMAAYTPVWQMAAAVTRRQAVLRDPAWASKLTEEKTGGDCHLSSGRTSTRTAGSAST